MAIADRLRWYLDTQGVRYEILPHPYTQTSAQTARAAGVPRRALAKPVLLEDERGYVVAIVPASHRIELKRLGEQLHRDLELAGESEIEHLFHDCAPGAMPPVGKPYRVPTVYDDALEEVDEVFFEAGDHKDVVRMSGEEFLRLLSGSLHGRFSH